MACPIGYADGIFALTLGAGAEPISLEQGIEPVRPALDSKDMVQLLLKID